jgi:hypothetical protein
VGSYQFDGVTFRVYPGDHDPPHTHARYQGINVILELCKDGRIRIADRDDAIRPGDAKRNQIRRIVDVASQHFDDLSELWEEAHA